MTSSATHTPKTSICPTKGKATGGILPGQELHSPRTVGIIQLYQLCGGKMSSIVRQKVGKHVYLYESVGFRNEEGKPRNRRWPIGKIDPVSGHAIYKPEYLARMAAEGRPLKIPQADMSPSLTLQDLARSSVRNYGAFYLFEHLATQMGLLDVLRKAMPRYWRQIFNLAAYLISTGDSFDYYENWQANTHAYPVRSMTTQRISKMLDAITQEERERFYQLWSSLVSEEEHVALDIPSSVFCPKSTECVAQRHNPNREERAQFNFWLLMAKESGYPVCQSVHKTGQRDVATLSATIAAFLPLVDDKPVTAVMDSSFFSAKNVNALLARKPQTRFLVGVPITGKFAINLVKNESRDPDALTDRIVHGEESMKSVTRVLQWTADHAIYAHVYYNDKKADKARDELYATVSKLHNQALKYPEKFINDPDYTKYLIIQRPDRENRNHTVNIREDVLRTELENTGWEIIISNCITSAKEAFEIYKEKNIVEKGFFQLKNGLEPGKGQVKNEENTHNRLFIGFVSLALLQGIHKIMSKKNLYAKMTMKKLMLSLSELKLLTVENKPVLLEMTREQRDIFRAFGIREPL